MKSCVYKTVRQYIFFLIDNFFKYFDSFGPTMFIYWRGNTWPPKVVGLRYDTPTQPYRSRDI